MDVANRVNRGKRSSSLLLLDHLSILQDVITSSACMKREPVLELVLEVGDHDIFIELKVQHPERYDHLSILRRWKRDGLNRSTIANIPSPIDVMVIGNIIQLRAKHSRKTLSFIDVKFCGRMID